jgi:hypothetical protein
MLRRQLWSKSTVEGPRFGARAGVVALVVRRGWSGEGRFVCRRGWCGGSLWVLAELRRWVIGNGVIVGRMAGHPRFL